MGDVRCATIMLLKVASTRVRWQVRLRRDDQVPGTSTVHGRAGEQVELLGVESDFAVLSDGDFSGNGLDLSGLVVEDPEAGGGGGMTLRGGGDDAEADSLDAHER